jgi:hypothetical protein
VAFPGKNIRTGSSIHHIKIYQMKKTIAFLSSLLVFAGLKAQVNPTIKKETTRPATTNLSLPADSLKAIKGNATLKLTTPGNADSLKAIKTGSPVLKQNNTLPMKENVLPVKPHKD